MSLFTERVRFHGKRTAPPMSRPSAKFHMGAPPQCAFCPSRAVIACEYPGCNLPMCARCRIRKSGGTLCRHHKKAYLLQSPGRPMIGDVAVKASPSKRFKAKGPARPHL